MVGLKWLVGLLFSGMMVLAGAHAMIESNTNVAGNATATLSCAFLTWWFYKKYKNSKEIKKIDDDLKVDDLYSSQETIKEMTKREKDQKQAEEQIKLKLIPGSKGRIKSLGAIACINAQHLAGLPLAEGTQCFVYLCNEGIVFERNETTYKLLSGKITDIVLKTETEIQKSHVSSIGAAVAGGVLFGPLGAIIGGREKEKTSKVESKYLIFSYDKDGSTDYISFDVTGVLDAYKFVNYGSKLPKERKEITL